MGLQRLRHGVLAALMVVAATPATGQRVQFPSALPTNTAPAASPGTTYGTAPGNPAGTLPSYGTTPAPAYGGGTPSTYGAGTTPSYGGATAPPYTPGTAPSYTPGTAPTYTPGIAPSYGTQAAPTYGPGVAPGPTATFQGDILPPPTWDPYATPGAAPATVFPQDPTMPVFPGPPSNTLTTMQRFLQEVRMDYVWIPGTASNEFGVNDVELTAEFAIPFLRNPQTPLLITPGFACHFWNGPIDGVLTPGLPPRAYDAFLNAAWNPQISRAFSGELAFRVGVYTDFQKVVNESIRYQGAGYGLVAFSPSFQIKAGVIYLDRNKIKILPAGGVIWTPNDDVRFEILFPNPKLAVRLPGYGTTEWWFYARGEYGGGAWTVELAPVAPFNTIAVDYNDMRVALGLDFETIRGLNGLVEVGLTFEREIFYPRWDFTFRPDPTVFVRGGIAY